MESNNNQTFTKFPNELLERIMCSKLNAAEIKILLCVVRYTYGFHREQHELSQSFIQNATDTSESHSTKMIQRLIKKSILIETKKATSTTPRCLAINPDFDVISKPNNNLTKTPNNPNESKNNPSKTENNPNLKSENPKKPNSNLNDNIINLNTAIEFNHSTDIELNSPTDVEFNICRAVLEHIQERNLEKKELKKEFKENSRVDSSVNGEDSKPLDMRTLKIQILVQYDAITKEDNTYSFKLEEVVDIFVFYYEEYRKHMGKDHPILSNESVRRIIEELPSCIDTSGHGYIELISEAYPDMIKKHFETSYQNCDYNILHFISGFIRAMRYYETTYE